MDAVRALCSADFSFDLLADAEFASLERDQSFREHAQMTILSSNERLVLGYRTLIGVDDVNEVHRIGGIGDVGGRFARLPPHWGS